MSTPADRATFARAFWLREKRDAEEWEMTLGMALVDGSLVIERMPEAEALRRVHYAAYWTQLAIQPIGRG